MEATKSMIAHCPEAVLKYEKKVGERSAYGRGKRGVGTTHVMRLYRRECSYDLGGLKSFCYTMDNNTVELVRCDSHEWLLLFRTVCLDR